MIGVTADGVRLGVTTADVKYGLGGVELGVGYVTGIDAYSRLNMADESE